MSAKGFDLTYNQSLVSLEGILEAVKRPGNYCCSGAEETPLPKLAVEGVGVLSFPVPSEQARQVIEVAAVKAPYGRGAQTLVDEKVRKVWQISPERLQITGKGWERSFKGLVEEVEEGLGCEPGSVVAELYKMLVYDEGGHFAPHRDSEKVPGMFGTLVVTLPSRHEGGDLVIRHHGRETVVSLLGDDPGEVRYAAFYADCEHEVHPVTSGYRVCMVYNLIARGSGSAMKAPDNQPAVRQVAELFRGWGASGADPVKLVYLLEHHYTQAALSWAGLKNGDAARASVLRAAAAQAGCAIHVGMVHIEEYGQADYNQGYRGRWSRNRGGEDDDASEWEAGEVDDGYYYIDQWRDPGDAPVAFGKIPLENEEILPTGSLDDEEADDVHFTEATGNAGVSFERTYLRAALVIWPESRFDDICISSGLEGALARLEKLVDAASTADAARAQASRKVVTEYLAKVPEYWETSYEPGPHLVGFLQQLIRLGEADVLRSELQKIPLRNIYGGGLNESLIACAGLLGSSETLGLFVPLFESASEKRFADLMDLWKGLAGRVPARSEVLMVCIGALTQAAHQPPLTPFTSSGRTSSFDNRYGDRLAAALRLREQARSHLTLTPTQLADFLVVAHAAAGAEPVCQFINALTDHPETFPLEGLVLPGLEHLAKSAEDVGVLTTHLWKQCASALLRRGVAPPAEPSDWVQTATIPGVEWSSHLRELEAFARDPQATVHRFKAPLEVRHQVERAIEDARLDMTCETERKGSPRTLVCTKTRATYEKARRGYQSQLQFVKRLLKVSRDKGIQAEELVRDLEMALGG